MSSAAAIVARIEPRAGRGAVRERFPGHQIAADDVERVESELLRNAVHESFERKVDLRARRSRGSVRSESCW